MKLRLLGSALVLMLAAASCADAGPGAGNGGSTGTTGPSGGTGPTHAGGATEVVLRVATEGGFVPVEVNLAAIPGFTAYGDGTTITTGPQIEIYPGPALPNVIATPLTDAGLDALVRAALDAGLAKDADHIDLEHMAISDMPTTVFTLVVDGTAHVTRVYALGAVSEQPPGMSDDEWTARRELETFGAKLGDLRSWLPAGSVGEDAPYVPSAMRIFVGPYVPDEQLAQPEIAWPLGSDLGALGEPTSLADRRCAVLEGADLDAVWPLAQRANTLTPWTSGGTSYSIVFRPLLPDESGC